MILSGMRVRHENAGDAEVSQLRHAGGAAASDSEIRHAIGEVHPVAKRGHMLLQKRMLGIHIPHLFIVRGARDVQDLNAHGFKLLQRHADDAIDAASALAAAHDEERALVLIELEEGMRIIRIRLPHRAADGRAHHTDIGMLRKERFAGFEAAQDDVGVAGVEFVRLAWDGVALVDERAALFFFAGKQRRKGGEASHAEHHAHLVLADDLAAALRALPQPFEKAHHLRRPRLRHGQEGHFLESQFLVTAGSEGVDLLLADEQSHLVPALRQHLAHGDARKQMPPRATARDEDVNIRLVRFQGWKVPPVYRRTAQHATGQMTKVSRMGAWPWPREGPGSTALPAFSHSFLPQRGKEAGGRGRRSVACVRQAGWHLVHLRPWPIQHSTISNRHSPLRELLERPKPQIAELRLLIVEVTHRLISPPVHSKRLRGRFGAAASVRRGWAGSRFWI